MNSYLAVLRKYAVFSGRARRQEYWMFFLFNLLFLFIAVYVDQVTGTFFIVTSIYSIAMIIPNLAVGVRRLHDIGRSGWWLLLMFVPVVGALVLFVFSVLNGESNENEYGPNPKHTRRY
jgi:uncharacterized membrane protein YhaH (DUF805 family)